MARKSNTTPVKYRAFTRRDIDSIPQFSRFDRDEIVAMKAVSAVLPFRVNNYVVEELIRWVTPLNNFFRTAAEPTTKAPGGRSWNTSPRPCSWG